MSKNNKSIMLFLTGFIFFTFILIVSLGETSIKISQANNTLATNGFLELEIIDNRKIILNGKDIKINKTIEKMIRKDYLIHINDFINLFNIKSYNSDVENVILMEYNNIKIAAKPNVDGKITLIETAKKLGINLFIKANNIQ